ncbi:kelch-like protein 18 [Branchiostoma floridae]|uniref:Kelch-like protein 18 n=1 Tax=Branchiostoma floridae TaxID=7739 RepID=A0A9J7LWH5_BRAFL|nr:kelch-like protein 18 [Branchiostoma floridae]
MAAADQEPHVSAVRPRSYQDESYLHGFLGTVDDLQETGVLQDVVLEVEGRRFPCHRLVLSAASPYFRAMFTSDMAESRQKTVVLQGLDAGMFGEILSYIYSGTLHVSLDKVQPLYQAADLLQLDYVRDTCSSYMAMNVERSNYLDLYKFADVFFVDNVRKCCLQSIAKHFTEVASSEKFYSLSVNQLTEIISHDESNEFLFMNPREEKYISCSYDLPRFQDMTVTSDNDIYILKTTNKFQLSLFKYNHEENVREELHRYDPSQDRWNELTPSTTMLDVFTAVAMGTEIFCTDMGFSQTIVYDTESDTWQKLQGWPNPGLLMPGEA